MIYVRNMQVISLGCFLFLCNIYVAVGFHEESIFENEDIYNQALPAVPHTGLVVPGTKWCGPGNTAKNFTDLGMHRDTDKCCRAHDHCPDIIEPQTSLHGLQNPAIFPILSCKCEQQFINCLQQVNTLTSNTMGRVYFGTQHNCFAHGYPTNGCKEYQNGTFRKRCIRYYVNVKEAKIWQFYNIPFYSISNATLNSLSLGHGYLP